MSLINEALKKAQRERQTDPGILVRNDDERHGAQIAPPPASPWPWIFASISVVVIALLVGVSLFIFSGKEEKPTPQPSESLAGPAPSEALPAALEPKPTPESAPAEAAPLTQTPTPAESIAPQPESTPKTTDKPARITANADIVALLKQIKVTGVLMSEEDGQSRIFIDNQEYWEGDTLNPQLQVKIAEVRDQSVVFVDESGVRYTKRF